MYKHYLVKSLKITWTTWFNIYACRKYVSCFACSCLWKVKIMRLKMKHSNLQVPVFFILATCVYTHTHKYRTCIHYSSTRVTLLDCWSWLFYLLTSWLLDFLLPRWPLILFGHLQLPRRFLFFVFFWVVFCTVAAWFDNMCFFMVFLALHT